MLTSSITRAWALLSDLTPLRTDCGALCSGACCAPDEDGQGGMYLFPGEAALIGDADWAQIMPGDGLCGDGMLVCNGHCERARRPLGCRIFPLTPIKRQDGGLGVRVDRRAFAMCPLAPSGKGGLDPAFVGAAEAALGLIWEEAEGRAFLRAWMALERAYGQGL